MQLAGYLAVALLQPISNADYAWNLLQLGFGLAMKSCQLHLVQGSSNVQLQA
jgi:hypothetical protein